MASSSRNAGEGPSRLMSRTAGRRTAASPGTSRAVEGERLAEHLSLKDFQQLLRLLKINLPRNVLNGEVIRKSRNFSNAADIIVNKLKRNKLRVVQKPRLQCRKANLAIKLKSLSKFREITEMIFFQKPKSNEKTLKEKWMRIPVNNLRGLRMKKTFAGSRSAVGEKMRKIKTQSQRNEIKCLQYFIREKKLSDVRYRREHAAESGFLSGRIDFLLKTKSNNSEKPEYIMMDCKSTKKNLQKNINKEGGVCRLDLGNKYDCQTRAYLYLLKKTKPHAASVKGSIIVKNDAEDDDEEEDDTDNTDDEEDEETDEETDEEENKKQDNEKDFKEYKAPAKKTKGKFFIGTVSEDTAMFEKLDEYCKEKAVPLYLAVLDKIFVKVEREH